MADRDRIRFLTGLLSKLSENAVTQQSRGQVYFAVDDKDKAFAKIYFDAPIDATTTARLPIYTDYAVAAGSADTATDALRAERDSANNVINTTYIATLSKGTNKTSLLYKRPGEAKATTINLEFLPLAGGTLTGAVTGTTITATSFVGPLTGNADTATKLKNKITIKTALDQAPETTPSFDGSQTYTGGVTGILGVANGGTGKSSWTASKLIYSSAANTLTNSAKIFTNGSYLSINNTTLNTIYPLYVNGNASIKGDIKIPKPNSAIHWNDGPYQQRINTVNDTTADTAVFQFQQSSDTGNSWTTLMTIKDNGKVTATEFIGAFTGNLNGTADKAIKDESGANIKSTYLSEIYTKTTAGYLESAVNDATVFNAGEYYTKSGTTYTKATSFVAGTQYYIKSNDVYQLWQHKGSDSRTSGNTSLVTNFVPLDSNGMINIRYVPRAALERLVKVASIAARNKLTTDDVQLGDTVCVLKQTGKPDNIMYIVVDTANLNNDSGYMEYTAATAAAVDWSNIKSRPDIIGTGVSSHNPIVLNTDGITFTLYKISSSGNETSYTIAPKFLPLVGGHVNGSTTIDDLTAGDLLVTGAASFNNTIKGNIETANKLKTKVLLKTSLDTDAGTTANFDGSSGVTLGVTGVLPVKHGGTGLGTPTANRLFFYSSGTTLSQAHYIASDKIQVNETTAKGYNFYVNGTSYFTGATTVNGALTAKSTLAVSGNTTIGGTLGVTGNTTLTGTLTVKNTASFKKSVTVSGSITGNTGATLSKTGTNDSTYSKDTAATLVVTGGVSVSKQLSAKTVRVDDGTAGGNGCTLTYNDTYSCLEFVFS